jgi:ribosomal protein L21E
MSDEKIIKLVQHTGKPASIRGEDKEQMMASLARLIEDIESGDLVNIAVAGSRAGGGTTTFFVTGGDIVHLMGSVSHLVHRLNLTYDAD